MQWQDTHRGNEFMRLKSLAILSASALALATPPAANAATFVFDLVGNSALDGTDGNARLFSATTGSKTINVRATGWNLNGGVVKNAFLGAFGTGLGVTNQNEADGSGNKHAIDNSSGNGRDFILLQFDKPVEFISGRFTTWEGTADSDATIDYGTTATTWNSGLALNNQSEATLNSLLNGSRFDVYGNSAPNGVIHDLQPGSPGQKVGNIWMVAASFVNKDKAKDSFKFDDLAVSYIDPLPEPGSWALMLGGFGMVGFALRRRRTLATA